MIWGNQAIITHSNRSNEHSHDMHELVVCLADAGRHTIQGTPYSFRRGRTFLLPGGVPHLVIPEPKQPAEILFACFDQDALIEFASPAVIRSVKAMIDGQLYVSGIDIDICAENVSVADRLAGELNDVGRLSQEMAGTLICALLINHWRNLRLVEELDDDREETRLNEVCSEILGAPAAPITIDEAAQKAGMSRATFTRKFRQSTGMSLIEFVCSARIRTAMRLLAGTSRDITSIAFECGFDNLGYFYRAFRKQTQRPPGKFRKELQSLGQPIPILRGLEEE